MMISAAHIRRRRRSGPGYAVGGLSPGSTFDFARDHYRLESVSTPFDTPLTFARTGTATYVDATGTLQTAADGEPRIGHHIWDGSQWVNEGLLIESEARTNLLHGTDSLPPQTEAVTAQPYTLSFRGTGSISLTGAHTDTLVGTGENDLVSLTFTPSAGTLTITPSGTIKWPNLEAGRTPSSHIPNTAGSGSVIRAAETLTAPSANLPWWTDNIVYLSDELVTNGTFDTDTDWSSITDWDNGTISGGQITVDTVGFAGAAQAISGLTVGTYYILSAEVVAAPSGTARLYVGPASDPGSFAVFNQSGLGVGVHTFTFVAAATSHAVGLSSTSAATAGIVWDNVSVREIETPAVSIQMDGAMTGESSTFADWTADASNGILVQSGTNDFTFTQEDGGTVDTVTGGSFTAGINVPFNIASRHGSTFINGAIDGTALTANTTPTALPDLSSTDLDIATDFMGTIKSLRIWADDLGDSGIEEASS